MGKSQQAEGKLQQPPLACQGHSQRTVKCGVKRLGWSKAFLQDKRSTDSQRHYLSSSFAMSQLRREVPLDCTFCAAEALLWYAAACVGSATITGKSETLQQTRASSHSK